MGIKSDFNLADAKKQFSAFVSEVDALALEMMQELGEKCVAEMRLNKTYMMQTGALTSSSGYSLFKDGVAIHSNFVEADGAKSDAAARGVARGEELAEQVGAETKGLTLVVVAGMHYAIYVESRGYNVISSAEQLAERELPRMLSELISNVKAAAE